jgi:hypothetical protein
MQTKDAAPDQLTLSSLFFPLMIALLGLISYLMAAQWLAGTVAFPLDDAWIHQTYARTLAEDGQWAFRAGEPSSGSTAPLWTLLLTPGHKMGAPVLWAYALGLVGWLATIMLGGWLSYLLFQDRTILWWTILALAAEWHLVWSALSGMEISLYTALILLLFTLYLSQQNKTPSTGMICLWGVLAGLLTLTRPEGLLLLGLLGAHWLWQGRETLPKAVGEGFLMAMAWLLTITPMLLFNWFVSGTLFPNTFYAKQQEYSILLATVPLWQRLLSLAWQPWLGGQALLLFALPWLPWRKLQLGQWLPLLWALAILLLYVLRLPVTYQHARYLMPTIPVFLLYGCAALIYALRRISPLFRRPLMSSVMVAFALFLLLGAQSYGQDVQLIECEMGSSAQWVADNSQPNDLIAAHDIGRLGYITQQPILDFAGLISPEAIPIIRNETALLELALAKNARLLVTFADWYPQLVQDERLKAVHATNCPLTKAAEKKPMTVYELRKD